MCGSRQPIPDSDWLSVERVASFIGFFFRQMANGFSGVGDFGFGGPLESTDFNFGETLDPVASTGSLDDSKPASVSDGEGAGSVTAASSGGSEWNPTQSEGVELLGTCSAVVLSSPRLYAV